MLFGLMHNFERISFFCAFYTTSSLRKPIFFARARGARDALVSALVGENRDEYMCVLKNGHVEYWSLEESPGRIQTQEAEKGKTELAGPKRVLYGRSLSHHNTVIRTCLIAIASRWYAGTIVFMFGGFPVT